MYTRPLILDRSCRLSQSHIQKLSTVLMPAANSKHTGLGSHQHKFQFYQIWLTADKIARKTWQIRPVHAWIACIYLVCK